MKPYKKENVALARTLRDNMTPWERKLWYRFLRDYAPRFQRQRPIGDYIVDFYCAKAALVIELDGGGHYTNEQIQKDAERTAELEALGLHVLRICNTDIDCNFLGACEYIDREIKARLSPSLPKGQTASSSEGAAAPLVRGAGTPKA